jgi:hypothetical protein
MQKVQKVEDVDPDQRSKRKLPEARPEEMTTEELQLRQPSPFETAFYSSSPKPEEIVGEEPTPDPSYSPPPNLEGEASPLPPEDDPLPHAPDFWANSPLPDEPSASSPLVETPQSAFRSPAAPGKKGKKGEGELFAQPPFGQEVPSSPPTGGPPHKGGKSRPFDKEKELAETEGWLLPDDDGEPSGRPQRPPRPSEKGASRGAPPWASELTSESEEASPGKERFSPLPPKKGEPSPPSLGSRQPPPFFQSAGAQEGAASKKRDEKKGAPLSETPAELPPLPAAIQPAAAAAAVQAAPYLNSDTYALFYQLVGTIFIAQREPGVTRTEIVLNSPSFANSRFFGATVALEKFSTAPDAFNIELSGSREAVQAFQAQLPSLQAAFQNGSFNFRINRLEAVYSADRPVFRRKKRSEGGREEAGGGLS